jgi:hypothetical protein
LQENISRTEGPATSEFAQSLERDLNTVRGKWDRLHKFYLFLHVVLVFAALVLSGIVIPYAATYQMSDLAFVSGLIVALIIGLQNAFAIGGRWAFYSAILAELQALTFQLHRCTTNVDQQDDDELERIAAKLEQINTRAFMQVPRGQGLSTVEEGNRPR